MTTTDVGEWLMRGHAIATIVFNDPVWAEQEYEMQRGERARGDYDPPLPDHFVDALRDRQRRLNALHNRMAAEGRESLPDGGNPQGWAEVDGNMLIAGRYADRRGIRWVPASLMAEFQVLAETPLPCSADAIGARYV